MDKSVEDLILNNKDLVFSTLNRMRVRVDDDTTSEGMLALIEAAQNFDPSIGAQFSTYAVSYIKGKIKTYLTLKTSIVKPSRIRGKYTRVESVHSDSEINEISAQDQYIESNLIVKDFISKLTRKEQVIANGLLEDKTQQQIGDELNMCQTQISRMIKVIRYKYMSYNIESRNY